ncbi:sensor histidine kinase [Microbacterium sp. 3J1]|uniref:sensor histidine kinase n=1 Tax=Microbacterium sp. 3J1 TaxID=861269 RepID=UPI000B30514E|nr:histidine kinase [Microbacterium sp. 3J1]
MTGHPRLGLERSDILVLVAYTALSVAFGWLSLESSLATPWWSLTVSFVGGIATILLVRRNPVASFIGVLVLLPVSFAGGSGLEAVLLVVAVSRIGTIARPRRVWTAFALAVASSVVAALVLSFRVRTGPPLLGLALRADMDAWPLDWLSITVVIVAALLISTLLGLNVGHRRSELRRLEERAEQLRRERDQEADLAAAAERERISREMHDVIAHSLSVMIAVADGAQATAESRPDESRRAIGRVAETGRRTLAEMRRLLTAVRGEDTSRSSSARPGIDQIPALVEEFRAAGLPVRLERTGTLDEEAVVGLTIYRIVQESLTNTLRHARDVREVVVRLTVTDRDVSIVVEDRSAPAAPPLDPGRGLVGIRERAAFYDGSVDAGPRPGGGWRIVVRLQTEDR